MRFMSRVCNAVPIITALRQAREAYIATTLGRRKASFCDPCEDDGGSFCTLGEEEKEGGSVSAVLDDVDEEFVLACELIAEFFSIR